MNCEFFYFYNITIKVLLIIYLNLFGVANVQAIYPEWHGI